MAPETIRINIDRKVVQYIEQATIRAMEPYEFVARAIAFLFDTGAKLTPWDICQYARELTQTANVHDITYDDLFDVLPKVVAALRSDNPIGNLKLRRP